MSTPNELDFLKSLKENNFEQKSWGEIFSEKKKIVENRFYFHRAVEANFFLALGVLVCTVVIF